ncbi:MFS transporter [Yinghuangia seranimata]|uniref:MFS transporter n=1 Tax=Yinghuangia seranimata TaxID=408067 RepID=UPI00248BE9A5|nr:MFS transporter [Yinghuangia seranimata]MDI2126530.1 MFS transporter [Yinghuangia seranimata]
MRKWGPLLAISPAALMLLIDITIAMVALPDMADDLGSSYTDLQWVMDAYSLALATVLMGAGSLADRVGRKRVFVWGTGLFTVASALCAFSPDTGTLIAARALQGIGGAAMFATTLALLGLAYEGRDRGVAFGVWGAVSGAAAAIGPVLGGVLTEHVGWEAVFLVNLPVGVLAIAMTLRLITESYGDRNARVDVPGTATFTAGAGLLTYGLIRAGGHGWDDGLTLGVLAGSAAALVAFVVVEYRTAQPMLELRLFRRASFAGIMAGCMFMQFAAFSCFPQVSVWFQSVLGYGPVKAGLALLPMAGTAFIVAAAASGPLTAVPPRYPIGVGIVLVGTGSLVLTLLDTGSDWTTLVPGLVLIGAGIGLGMPQMAAAAYAAVPPERSGMAGGALNTFRQLGFALGVAVVGVVFRAAVGDSVDGTAAAGSDPHATAEALGGGQAGRIVGSAPADKRGAVADAIHHAFATGLDRVFVVCGVIGVAAGVLVLLTVDTSPESASAGRGAPEQASAAADQAAAET